MLIVALSSLLRSGQIFAILPSVDILDLPLYGGFGPEPYLCWRLGGRFWKLTAQSICIDEFPHWNVVFPT